MSPNDANSHLAELPRVGDVIDERYRLGEAFASGGMGVIMKAEQLRTGREVAVKLLHPHIAAKSNFAKRFKREVRVATLFDHPNIVRVYDVGETDRGALYLVMELLDGEELQDVIDRESPLCAGRVIDIGLQMLDGLAEAHSQNVVHRDFKPANVFVGQSRRGKDRVKLLDFGIAKLVNSGESQLTATGHYAGTPGYIAPETMVDESMTGQPQLDVYAAGLVLVEMMTGKRVFQGEGMAQTLLQHLKKPVLIPNSIDRTPLGEVIRKSTAKHPADRYRDADAMYVALEEARHQTPADLKLEKHQIPTSFSETSPSILRQLADQAQDRSLGMLRQVPQHQSFCPQTHPDRQASPSVPDRAQSNPSSGGDSLATAQVPKPDFDDDFDDDFDVGPTRVERGGPPSTSGAGARQPAPDNHAGSPLTSGVSEGEHGRQNNPVSTADSEEKQRARPANQSASPPQQQSDDVEARLAASSFSTPNRSESSDDESNSTVLKWAIVGLAVVVVGAVAAVVGLDVLEDSDQGAGDGAGPEALAAGEIAGDTPANDDPRQVAGPQQPAGADGEVGEENIEEPDQTGEVSLSITSEPAGAEVRADGRRIGETDLDVDFQFDDFPRRLEFQKDGYQNLDRSLADRRREIEEAGGAEVHVQLQQIRPQRPEPEPEPEPELEPEPEPEPPSQPEPEPEPEPQPPAEDRQDDVDDEPEGSSVDSVLDQHLGD